jgi:hypothetical protein
VVREHPLDVVVPPLEKLIVLEFPVQKVNLPFALITVTVKVVVGQVLPQLLLNLLLV